MRGIIHKEASGGRPTEEGTADGCDTGEICIRTGTGSVTGSLLSGKTFITGTTTGSIKVPKNDDNGGRCQISTTTGSIKITVK